MMRQPAWMLVAVLFLCSPGAGCAWRHVCASPCSPSTEPYHAANTGTSDRGQIKADVTAVGPYKTVDAALPRPYAAAPYLKCRAEECQCRAAASAAVADLLDAERQLATTGAAANCGKKAQAYAVAADLLALRAADERNRTAALALEAFYHLADAESARDSLRNSLAETQRSLDNFEQIKARGLHLDTDDRQLRQQQRELLDRQAELELSTAQINWQLKLLLGVDPRDPTPIWPEVDLTVVAQGADAESAVATGLTTRADLAILRLLVTTLDVETLPAARSALQQVDASLGSQGSQLRAVQELLHPAQSDREVDVRRCQLQRLLSERERMAIQQILAAAATVDTNLRQIAIAKDACHQRRQRLEQLDEKRSAGSVTPLERAAAQLEMIRADRDLIHQVVEWRIAQVKLKEAQGSLAVECGCGVCGNGGSAREHPAPTPERAP
jgi:hypothetical protein